MSEPVLCYVEGQAAYFTTQPLEKQWGDDWNDVPYEHNAGTPYQWHSERDGEPYEIIKVYFDSELDPPCEWFSVVNSPVSVQHINAGAVAWLQTSRYLVGRQELVKIMAGTTLDEFTKIIKDTGGKVYREV